MLALLILLNITIACCPTLSVYFAHTLLALLYQGT